MSNAPSNSNSPSDRRWEDLQTNLRTEASLSWHPEASPELEASLEKKLRDLGLFDERPEFYKGFRRMSPGRFGPCVLPCAKSLERLELVALYWVAIFLFDDVLEDIEDVISLDGLGKAMLVSLGAIKGELAQDLVESYNVGSFMRIFEFLGGQFRDTMEKEVLHAFYDLNCLWADSIVEERQLLAKPTHPSVTTFFEWRRGNNGGLITILLAEYSADVYSSDHGAVSDVSRRLVTTLDNLMMLQNDLASVAKDKGRLSIIFAMQQELGLSMGPALGATRSFFETCTAQAIEDAQTIVGLDAKMANWVLVVVSAYAGLR